MSFSPISSFCSLTGASAAEAEFWLSAADCDLQRAVAAYYEEGTTTTTRVDAQTQHTQRQHGTIHSPNITSHTQYNSHSTAIHIDDDSDIDNNTAAVPAPLAARTEVLQQPAAPLFAQPPIMQQMRAMMNANSFVSATQHNQLTAFQPIHSTLQNNPYANEGETGKSIWRDDKLSKLFEAPVDIITRVTSLEHAFTLATQQHKWLCVNVQFNDLFASHCLNRDVWRDKHLKQILSASFIFSQIQSTTSIGREYQQLYNITHLPHIGLLDPRTRLLVWGWDNQVSEHGKMTADRMCVILTQFTQFNNFDDFSAVRPPADDYNSQSLPSAHSSRSSNSTSTSSQQQFNQASDAPSFNANASVVDYNALTEEEQLELAIKQSMEEAEHDQAQAFQLQRLYEQKHSERSSASNSINQDTTSLINSSTSLGTHSPSFLAPIELPPEPAQTSATTALLFNFPSHRRISRRFYKTDPCSFIHRFVHCEFQNQQQPVLKWRIVTRMPRIIVQDSQLSIEKAGIGGSSLFVEAVVD